MWGAFSAASVPGNTLPRFPSRSLVEREALLFVIPSPAPEGVWPNYSMNNDKFSWTFKRMFLVKWALVIMENSQELRSGIIVLLRKSTMLHCTPMQMPGFAISKGKRKNKSASGAAQLVLTETLLHDVSFFTQERIFLKATIPELYGCMQNASAPADEVISTEDWLPSKRKEELLRCFWKRWKNFQNSSLMLYHIWDFQIHSWVENHFRLQAIWLTVSVAPSTQSFIYLLVTKEFLFPFSSPSASFLLRISSCVKLAFD